MRHPPFPIQHSRGPAKEKLPNEAIFPAGNVENAVVQQQ